MSCTYIPGNSHTSSIIGTFIYSSLISTYFFFVVSLGVGFELFSTLLGVGIYTFFFVILVHSSSSSDCDAGGERLVDPKLKAAYQWHSVVVAAIVVACVSITVIFIKESEGKNLYQSNLPTICVWPAMRKLQAYLFI